MLVEGGLELVAVGAAAVALLVDLVAILTPIVNAHRECRL